MTTMVVQSGLTTQKWNTLQVLKGSRALLLALDGLLLIALVVSADVHRHAMRTVGRDSAPSIMAAQHIKAALADLDADEAKILLGPPNTASSATKGQMHRTIEADEALLAASGNVTYDAERAPIETLVVTGGFYNRLAQQTEDLHDAGNPLDLNYYEALAILIDARLLPAADALDRANDVELQRTYSRTRVTSILTTTLVALVGLAVLGGLFWIQIFLSERTRRTINPALALATLATAVLLLYGLGALLAEQKYLKLAKQDAFESIHALWQARAVAYHANAEESRYLLDPRWAADADREFFRETALLAKLPPGMSFDDLIARERRGDKVEGFSGYLADELNNITFPGERVAAVKTLEAYKTYLEDDAELRRLQISGDHQAAVDLCVGSATGQSDWAFAQFDHALDETLRINREQFDRAVDAGLRAVGDGSGRLSVAEMLPTLEFKALILSVVIAILASLGLGLRIREYE